MPTVIVTIGIPASGKTTWARQYARENENTVVVSRDDIRLAHGWKSGFDENRVTKIHRAQIEAALLNGFDVVVADTNINGKFRRELIKFCHEHGADVIVKLFPVTLDEAIRRDTLRANTVGPDVVSRFHGDFNSQDFSKEFALDENLEALVPVQTFAPYSHSEFKKTAIVIDIDGTVARHWNRSPYDESKVFDDKPIHDVIDVVNALSEFYYPVFVSGRTDGCEAATREWLTRWFHFDIESGNEYELFMRKKGDTRPDWVVKGEIYDNYVIPNYDIKMVFDDRDQVVRHIRARGITVAQVAPGRF